MRVEAPVADHVLRLWEAGASASAARRGLLLVSAAVPDRDPAELARLPLGWCAARLAELRAALFGPDLDAVAACADCGEAVEIHFDLKTLLGDAEGEAGSPPPIALTHDGYRLQLRCLSQQDLLEAEREDDAAAALALCAVGSAERAGEMVSAADLPAEVWDAVEHRLAGHDPHAQLDLAMACPQCGRLWTEPLDLATFLWSEVDALARTLLAEVAILAAAFSWCEADILALTPARRRAYLALAE
jgi:hypothetical protein